MFAVQKDFYKKLIQYDGSGNVVYPNAKATYRIEADLNAIINFLS